MDSGRKFGFANRAVGLLFLAAAALQWNDPDPLRWVVVYAAASIVCFAAPAWKHAWVVAAAVGCTCAAWAMALLPGTAPDFKPAHLLSGMKAGTPSIEQGREILGLAVVATWMAIVAISRRRARAS